MYYTYMLRCEDETIYTGMAKELDRRFREHCSQAGKCAKYTKSHPARSLEAAWESEERSEAARLEYQIKRLSRPEKERLLSGTPIEELLGKKLDASAYRRLEKQRLVQIMQKAATQDC